MPVAAPADPIDLLRDLDRALAERGLRWYVFGAQAVVAHGRPRATADVDVAIEVGGSTAFEIVEHLGRHGFDLRFPLDGSREPKLLPMVHRATAMPLDVVITTSGLHEEFLARAKRSNLGGVEVPVVSAEDLVAMKVLAGRRKDLEDVRGVLLEQAATLDVARVREVVRAFEVVTGDTKLSRRLERLLRAALSANC